MKKENKIKRNDQKVIAACIWVENGYNIIIACLFIFLQAILT
jgi:hypothetical protein